MQFLRLGRLGYTKIMRNCHAVAMWLGKVCLLRLSMLYVQFSVTATALRIALLPHVKSK